MKTIKVASIAAILVVALIFTNFSPAEARKAGVDDKLSPKSFGLKTNQKISIEKSYSDKSEPIKKPFGLKSEQIKTKLKMAEAKKGARICQENVWSLKDNSPIFIFLKLLIARIAL
jgi:hypothetical protein